MFDELSCICDDPEIIANHSFTFIIKKNVQSLFVGRFVGREWKKLGKKHKYYDVLISRYKWSK